MKKPVRFAVVGLGHIAQVAVLPAFRHAKANARLTALVTGTPKKARLLSRKYRVAQVCGYADYDALLASGTIDAVYIALPNEMHVDYTCRALAAGIHVLCEKPLAVTSADCHAMIAASEKSGAKLMTAYRLHFDKPNVDAFQLCRSQKLGALKTFVSSFSYVVKDKSNIRLRPIAGSGPLWDIGIYCINAARSVFRENPVEVFAYGTYKASGPFAKVPASVTTLLRFSEDKIGTFTCSFDAAESSYFEVYGDKGMLRLQNAYEYAFPPELHTLIGKKRSKKKYKKVDQFAAELNYFATCLAKNKTIEPSGAEGLADVAILEAIEKAMITGKPAPVDYGSVEKKADPKPAMVQRKPPVDEPELVDVKSASGD